MERLTCLSTENKLDGYRHRATLKQYLAVMYSLIDFFITHACLTQISFYLLVIGLFWYLESRNSDAAGFQKLRHTSVNLMVMLSALPIQILSGIVLIAVSHWVTAHHFGVVYMLPFHSSAWIKYAFMFLVLDFLDYVYHTATHRFAGLWKFHLVHHTDSKVDVSTTIREHPVETFIRNAFLIVYVLISGASFGVLFLRQLAQTAANISAHTNLSLPPKASYLLGMVFITPSLHRTHHHFQLPYTNCNYGDVFSFWDRIFGTYRELPQKTVVVGLDTHMDESATGSYIGAISLPFRKNYRLA